MYVRALMIAALTRRSLDRAQDAETLRGQTWWPVWLGFTLPLWSGLARPLRRPTVMEESS
jgi:hypothetical protein